MTGLVVRTVTVIYAALAIITFSVTPARSLSAGEVERVVKVLEQLADDIGDLAYDEEAAEIWYEEDEAYEQRIAAAGFSRAEWIRALDATMKGYFASLSNERVAEMLAPLLEFERRQDLSEAQKAAARAMIAAWYEKMATWRAQGAADAAVVRPFAERIARALGADDAY